MILATQENGLGRFLHANMKGHAFGLVLGTGMGMASGESFGRALLEGAAYDVAYALAPGAVNAKMAYDMITTMGPIVRDVNRMKREQWEASFHHNMAGRPWVDTEASATMRQRAVQAIQNSKLNARSVLGQEASLMHQGLATPPYMRSQRMGW
jgi:hypothetical protein